MKRKKTSEYHGVSLKKATRTWVARVTINGLAINVGSFSEERAAARAVDICLIRNYKEPKNFKWTKSVRDAR